MYTRVRACICLSVSHMYVCAGGGGGDLCKDQGNGKRGQYLLWTEQPPNHPFSCSPLHGRLWEIKYMQVHLNPSCNGCFEINPFHARCCMGDHIYASTCVNQSCEGCVVSISHQDLSKNGVNSTTPLFAEERAK